MPKDNTSKVNESLWVSNESATEDTLEAFQIFHAITLCLLAFLGLIFNAFIVLAVLLSRRLRSKVVYGLSCHLGLSGVVWCLIVLPVSAILLLLGDEWIWSQTTCNMLAVACNLCVQISIWTIVLLSWEKYKAIVLPLHHPTAVRSLHTCLCLSSLWLLSLVTDLFPIIFSNGYIYDRTTGFFDTNSTSDEFKRIYVCLWLLATFYLPLAVLVFCYVRIFAVARQQNKRIIVMAAMVRVITLSVGVPLTKEQAQRSTQHVTSRNKRASQTICKFLGAFVLCYIPYATIHLVGQEHLSSIICSLSGFLLSASPSVNAFVYGIKNKVLRNSLRHYIDKKFRHKSSSYLGTMLRPHKGPMCDADII